MIISAFALAAAAASKWLLVAKIATAAGAVCLAAQPVADAYNRQQNQQCAQRHDDDEDKKSSEHED